MAGRITAGTERALRRHTSGEQITAAARAEGVDPSTVFRALKRMRKSGAELPRQRIVIAGAGALGRELMGWLRMDGCAASVAFIDDLVPAFVCNWLGALSGYQDEARDDDALYLAVAGPATRAAIAAQLGAVGATFIARSASITGECEIGAGSLLLPHCLVSANAVLGRSVIVNTYSGVGHDVVVGDYCTLSSHVDLTGKVRVGDRVLFGSGARVLPGLTIGNDAVIGAGAVVVKDVPAGATIFGNPGRQVA